MTKREYADYEQRVAAFFEREGITNLSTGHINCPECHAEWTDGESGSYDQCPNGHGKRETWDEPHFSWSPCECCQRRFGGDRYHATGWNPTDKEIQEYNICSDCMYYAEYGRLDDMTMLDVERDTSDDNGGE